MKALGARRSKPLRRIDKRIAMAWPSPIPMPLGIRFVNGSRVAVSETTVFETPVE
jgi:hypothetical protein